MTEKKQAAAPAIVEKEEAKEAAAPEAAPQADEKPAAQASKAKEPKADDTPVTRLKIKGLVGARQLRLTECGGAPLGNGATLLVHADLAQKLVEAHPDHLLPEGKTEMKAWAPGKRYEVLSTGSGGQQTATGKATGKPTAAGQAANKKMGAASTK